MYLIIIYIVEIPQQPPSYVFIKYIYIYVPITLMCGIFITGKYETLVAFTFFFSVSITYLGFVILYIIVLLCNIRIAFVNVL